MREIKFRALRDDMSDCNFKYGCLIYDDDGCPRIQDGNNILFYTCLKGTEGQYTGLKDKNGVDIYEGDIVFIQHDRINYKIDLYCEIKYIGSGFKAVICKENELLKIGSEMQIWNEFEVIGNIHQNKQI